LCTSRYRLVDGAEDKARPSRWDCECDLHAKVDRNDAR
jgi:hypothetical protein